MNMKSNYYILLAGLLMTASCSKEILTEIPTFDVSTEATTYQAGEEIKFNIAGGDAQTIFFYSGETLKDYAFKEGRIIDVKDSGAAMAFTSSVQLGTQANQLTVLASTDFNGDYSTLAKVKAAIWTDITGRFKLGINNAFLASGTKDISDLLLAGKPIYIAFKYVTKPQITNGLARNWYIQAFAITSNTKLDNAISLELTDQANAGFRIIDENPATAVSKTFVPYDGAPARASITNTRIALYGNQYLHPGLAIFDPDNPVFDPLNPIYDPGSPSYSPIAVRPTYVAYNPSSPYNDPLSEHWAVSKAINTEKVDLGPDWSTSIKDLYSQNLTEYRYTYAKAGTYEAVFVASNNSIDGEKKVIKEITLTITP